MPNKRKHRLTRPQVVIKPTKTKIEGGYDLVSGQLDKDPHRFVHVICVNVGIKYTADYVYKLKAMVDRYLTTPHSFTVFTDRPSLYENIRAKKAPVDAPGWWSKIGLFKPDLDIPTEKGRDELVLYFDLDTVIVGNINHFADKKGFHMIDKERCLTKNLLMGSVTSFASGVMSWEPNTMVKIWTRFGTNAMDKYKGDQDYITAVAFDDVTTYETLDVVSYKASECQEGYPAGTCVVAFHGVPRPHQVKGGWVEEKWG